MFNNLNVDFLIKQRRRKQTSLFWIILFRFSSTPRIYFPSNNCICGVVYCPFYYQFLVFFSYLFTFSSINDYEYKMHGNHHQLKLAWSCTSQSLFQRRELYKFNDFIDNEISVVSSFYFLEAYINYWSIIYILLKYENRSFIYTVCLSFGIPIVIKFGSIGTIGLANRYLVK